MLSGARTVFGDLVPLFESVDLQTGKAEAALT
jgi:hypothetical protein